MKNNDIFVRFNTLSSFVIILKANARWMTAIISGRKKTSSTWLLMECLTSFCSFRLSAWSGSVLCHHTLQISVCSRWWVSLPSGIWFRGRYRWRETHHKVHKNFLCLILYFQWNNSQIFSEAVSEYFFCFCTICSASV